GFGDARRIVGGTRLVRFGPLPDDAEVAWRFVPDHPDLPMEEVYPRSEPPEPAVFGAPLGAGRVDVVGFNATELYWQALQADHLTLLGNAVRRGLGDGVAAAVRGPGVLDVATWAGERAFTVLAANLPDPVVIDGARVELDLDRVGALAGGAVPGGMPGGAPGGAAPGAVRVQVLGDAGWVDAAPVAHGRLLEVPLPPVRELAAVRLTW